MKLKKPENIREIVNQNKLTHIVIETGNENIYIPKENKFIVNKQFLSNTTQLLHYSQLKTVDLTRFDFSEISTMACWFYSCIELEEVIFPEKVNCDKLKSLTGCFVGSNIKSLNMENWIFGKQEVSLERMCQNCVNLKSLILPAVNIKYIRELAQYCENLENVKFSSGVIKNIGSFDCNYSFAHCKNLQLIDVSDSQTSIETLQYMFTSTYVNALNKANPDCLIVLPN